MGYSRIFGSNFPNELIPVGTKKDIDDKVKGFISQYYNYIDAGNITAANNLYSKNAELLEPYIIDMAYINRLEEEIYNTGLSALTQYQVIQSESEPPSAIDDGMYWIQEYE